jgi:hypothetical protein
LTVASHTRALRFAMHLYCCIERHVDQHARRTRERLERFLARSRAPLSAAALSRGVEGVRQRRAALGRRRLPARHGGMRGPLGGGVV